MARSKTFISLAEHNPELVCEWDFSANGDISPYNISYGSAIPVYWKCSQNHKWPASPNHRSRGRGCPECAKIKRAISRRKTEIKKNGSLAENNPALARQWHPTLNGSLTPYDVTACCPDKVWWQCEKDKRHEWPATIHSRNSDAGCPICSGHRIVVGINDLATVRPDLAKQWHPTKNGDLKPTQVTAHNGKSVWWLCEKDKRHEWPAKIANRTNGDNCPICSGKKVLVGYNDLATILPSLAKEWHPIKNQPLTPYDVTVGSNKQVWWKCEKGHEWPDSITHRSSERRCPKCFGEAKTSFPEQVIFFYLRQVTTACNRYRLDTRTEIDVYLPEYKIGVEYDGSYFHEGEEAKQREAQKQEKLNQFGITLIRVREIEGQTSEYTIYLKRGANDIELTKTIKDLLVLIEQVARVSFDIDVDVARDRGKIYEQYIQSEKERSLAVINPELALEWHPTKNGSLRPEYVSANANKKVWWQCKNGHEWPAFVNSRNKGVGCSYCAGQRVIVGYNDLATVNPKLSAQWHPTKNENLKPQDVMVNSNISVWWQCEKGHEWKTAISHRSRGDNCPYCSGRKVLVGYNDLATLNPKLASEWHPTKNKFFPQDVTCGSSKKVWWQCENAHEWPAVISSRNNGRGCPYCSNQLVLKGYNDLETKNPKLAAEWHPTLNKNFLPSDFMPNSNKKAWWKCENGHEWEAVISSRNAGRGCKQCYEMKRKSKEK